MSELIELVTPDYKLSIWASDISLRREIYQKTLLRRRSPKGSMSSCYLSESGASELNNQDLSYSLRFSPSIRLEEVNSKFVSNIPTPDVFDVIHLSSPLFFENSQYHFEWIFFGRVSDAKVVHRTRCINEAFRFSEEFATPRGSSPARLTGVINTGNDVGWMRLPLVFEVDGLQSRQQIAFEVLPIKMLLHDDLPAMYRSIDDVYPLWRFSLAQKTEQDAANSRRRGFFPLMWLANFTALRYRFLEGLKIISSAPHSRLQSEVTDSKADRLKGRVSNKLSERVRQDIASKLFDKRYRVERKKLSVDTPENRFIKMAVLTSERKLERFEAALRANDAAPENQRFSGEYLQEINSWRKPLQRFLKQSFLSEVGDFVPLNTESLVLQQKTGYSAVYHVWQELKFYLDVFGNQSSISVKSVEEIYEVWCFLCIKQMLENDLGFILTINDKAKLTQNSLFEYQMKDGFAGAFSFSREDGVTARLAHEPRFSKSSNPIKSPIVVQRPDIVLEITVPSNLESIDGSVPSQKFIWLFDAKYRIKNRFLEDAVNSQEKDAIDQVPDDAINQMHRYRDSLIRFSNEGPSSLTNSGYGKNRPVFGAFALYPGFFDQVSEKNPYEDAIKNFGIGAFALLPSQDGGGFSGHKWLLDFLVDQVGVAASSSSKDLYETDYPRAQITEKLYLQEAARIPYGDMQQVLYRDLTLTAALGGREGRNDFYFEAFNNGSAKWYHMPQATFSAKYKDHVVHEIRYLALAIDTGSSGVTKCITKLWPVKRVTLLPRHNISREQSGKSSDSGDLHYLFELGAPLSLHKPITNVIFQPFMTSMRLTTLRQIEVAHDFSELKSVYEEVIVAV